MTNKQNPTSSAVAKGGDSSSRASARLNVDSGNGNTSYGNIHITPFVFSSLSSSPAAFECPGLLESRSSYGIFGGGFFQGMPHCTERPPEVDAKIRSLLDSAMPRSALDDLSLASFGVASPRSMIEKSVVAYIAEQDAVFPPRSTENDDKMDSRPKQPHRPK